MSITSHQGFRIAVLAATLLGAVPTVAATAADCQKLCGEWQLDAGTSDDVEAALDIALAQYSGPRPEHYSSRAPRTLEGSDEAQLERSLGPISDRPDAQYLRAELSRLMKAPPRLAITAERANLLIAALPDKPRRLSPGVPHSRIDAEGTAEIRCVLKGGRLTVTERYDRKREYVETYAVQQADGSLLVTREVRRPGMKKLRLKALYRPA